jgi:FkbM family methyltransferase
MIRGLLQRSINLVPWSVRHLIGHIPGVAPLQRAIIQRFLSRSDFLYVINGGPAKGLRIKLTLPRDKSLWTGTYEAEFAAELSSAIQPGAVAYDIGGFRGFMSAVMALAGAKRVITFEPLGDNVQQLHELTLLNPALPIEVRAIAVGDRDGETTFEQMPEPSMGKLSESEFQTHRRGIATVCVPMRSIDSLVDAADVPAPDVIKIDVEGAEVRVLKGAIHTLHHYKPTVFVEAHSPGLAAQCAEQLTVLGYAVSQLSTGSVAFDPNVTHLRALAMRQTASQ